MRPSSRSFDAMREVTLATGVAKYAEGSCLAKFGDTHVLCTATVEERVPPFLRNTGRGWVTAEYGMLPRSTHTRTDREAARGRQSGRTQEIQRLIGRSLRAAVDFSAMGERSIYVDCDVIVADGGTRTASITGGYVALALAMEKLVKAGLVKKSPLRSPVAAISTGTTCQYRNTISITPGISDFTLSAFFGSETKAAAATETISQNPYQMMPMIALQATPARG